MTTFLIEVCYTCDTITAIDFEPGNCTCEAGPDGEMHNLSELIPTEAADYEEALEFIRAQVH